MPTGVVFTTVAQAPTSANTPAKVDSARAELPTATAVASRAGERFTTVTRAPCAAKAAMTARAVAPAPITATDDKSAPAALSASTQPTPSVLCPTSKLPLRTTVLTAPTNLAAGCTSSSAAITISLWGIVMDKPAIPKMRMASIAAVACSGCTSNAAYIQSSPWAANAAL